MIKINRKSKEGIKKKIASLSLIALLFNATMIGVLVPSNILNACEDKTIHVEEPSLSDHKCNSDEWHFIINQIDKGKNKPANINVEWSNSTSTTLELDLNDPSVNAHYRTTDNLNLDVTDATATIYDEWNGKFNLSHGPCNTLKDAEVICTEYANEGKTVVMFPNILVQDSQLVSGPVQATISTGIYEVTLVSYDGHDGRSSQNQPQEQWYAVLNDASYGIVAMTNESSDLDDSVDYITKEDIVNTELIVSDNVTSVTAYHAGDVETGANSVYPVCAIFEYKEPKPETVTIVASKIVCDDEANLPNWGAGGSPITEDTATEFIADNPDCHLEENWYFQVGDQNATKKNGDYYNEAPEDSWTTFGPTVNGEVETTVDMSNITGSQLRLREVLQDGYIPFTYNDTTGDNSNNVSAEFYCADDVYKYDNYDWITNPQAGETYYCVAFNAPIESDCTDEDEDGYTIEGESCGPIDCNDDDASINPGATEICGNDIDENCDGVIEECAKCDLMMARVVIENYNSECGAILNNQIYVGSKTNIYASGEWFPVYENGGFINDPDIIDYEDVDGLAIQREEGTIRAVLYRGGSSSQLRHLEGYIEFYNASVDSPLRDDNLDTTNDNHLEYGFNGTTGDAGNDEVWIENGLSYFYLGVTSGDDGYYTDYSSLPIEECLNSFCGDGIKNQSWEECDRTDGLFESGFNTCTEQCQFEGDDNCSDLVLARVNVTDSWNDQSGNGNMTSDIYLGSETNSVSAGTWFGLYHNGSYINDANIYEDVPGLAIQRLNGNVRAVIYGSASSADIEHIDGNIEFYNASVVGQTSDDSGNNRLEKGFDDNKGGAGDDEIWTETNDNNHSYFWLTVNTADDGYYTNWEIIEDCIACESELRIDITYFANFGEDNPDMSDNVYVGNSLFGQSIITIPLTTNDRTNAIIDASVIDNDNVPGLHIQRGEDTNGSYFEISAYGFNHNLTRESIKANTQLINATISRIENGPDGGYENPLDGICGITEGDEENDLPGNDEYSFIDGANAGKMCSITNVHRDRIRVYYEPTEECGIYCGNGQIDSSEQCDDGNNTDGDGCSAICTTETPEYGPYCGDGINGGDIIDGIQDWEQCDSGHLIGNDPIVGCSVQCQIMGTPECSEDVFARIVVTDVGNEGNDADMTNNVYLGTNVLPIPHNVWFAVHYDDSYITDGDIDTYQDVPGLAVQRQNGQVRVQIYGSHPNDETWEHIKGYIEFYNEEALNPLVNDDTSAENKMEGSDWNTTVPTSSTPVTAGRDYAWIDGNKSHFWMTVTTADDGYFTPYETPICDEDPICSIFGHKYNKTGIGLVDWIIGLAQIVDCTENEEWADSVVSYSPVGTIADERDDPDQALNETDYNETSGTYNFVSLGIGGELVLEFDNLILNKTGDDIEVVETSWGSPACSVYPERINVYASQNGTDWEDLGGGCLDSTFDLGGLAWAKYIKINDTTVLGENGYNGDGYDIDAVKALHCGNGTITTTKTNADGEYCFADVNAGDYKLYEEMQSGWDILEVLIDQVVVQHLIDSFFDVFVEITVIDGKTITVDFYNEEDVSENQAPVITLTVNPLTLIVGSSFDPYNGHATANDHEDGDITGDIVATGSVDTNTAGTYYVDYDVMDSENKPAETKTLKVIVEDGDDPVDPGDVIINEIMWTGNSDELNDQWIELKNVSSDPVNLKGCQLKYHKDTGNENKIAYLSDSIDVILGSNTFYLVSHYAESTSHINSIDPGLSGTADVNSFEYNEFQIKLYCPDATGALVEIDTVGDAVNPPAFGDNNDPKKSMQKCESNWEDALVDGTTYNWDANTSELGTPGLPNVCENNSQCTDGEEETCYNGPTGTENVGICHAGTRTCANNVWGECIGEVTPQGEICGNGIDEDCNGADTGCGGGGGGGGSAIIAKPSIRITNEKVIYLGTGEAMVTWTTNIETTRQVAYGDDSISVLGVAPEYGYDSVNTESTDMTKEHDVTISGLTDGIPYYFRPVADRAGSTGEVVGIEVFYEIGEVKGIEAPTPVECNYLLEYIKLGADNNPVEVKKLEWFLNEFEEENLAINGIYEQVDFDAVSRFQERYLEDVLSPWSHTEATGYVYITTKKKINELYCKREFPLTDEQRSEIARFSGMFYALAEGIGIPSEYNIFTPEDNSAREGTSEYYEEEAGEVAGAEDEAENETKTKDESENGEGIEGLTDKGTLIIDGDTEDKIVYDDNGYPDYYFWIVVISLVLIIATIYYLTNIRRKPKKTE